MKSAYEIAMERLNAEAGPSRSLSDEEKEQIADIESRYDAEVAQLNLEYEPKIAVAMPPEADGMRAELASKIASVEERREKDKAAVWDKTG